MSQSQGVSEFRALKRVILSCVAGSSLEWFDFALYGYFAAILGRAFFPSGDSFQQLIASFGAFASGLIARPLGAILFGYIGDLWGRKRALLISIYLMALPTAGMSLLPTHAQIGAWAGVLLTLMRILQGLALGGGFTGTIVFLYEHSSQQRKATFSSWAPFSLVFGFVIGALTATFMTSILDSEQLESWGWRVPFALSFFGTFIARYVRNKLQDPEEFLAMQREEPERKAKFPLRTLFKDHWKAVVLVVWIDILTACGYFLLSVFFPTYFGEILGFDRGVSFLITTTNMIFFALSILLGGWLADRLGKRRLMLWACVALAASAYPLFLVFSAGPLCALFGHLGLIVLFSLYYGPIPATICSIFPTRTRLLGVSLAHNFAMAVFGAYAPTYATYLVKWSGNITTPSLLFVASALTTAVGLYVWEEGKNY
ncbi:MAG: MFS transporter [Holosporales bacterium]|jgi:MHS family proline/betaine transporter-like MFS transporter|nr:MFS transporter [Holosporales bacterium]